MSITGINNQSGTYVNAMSYHQIVPERAKLGNAHLISDEFLYNNSKSQEEALKVLNVINEDKHCAKNVDKIKMAQMILKVAKEFYIDPVVLACIIRQETHFTPQYGKNGRLVGIKKRLPEHSGRREAYAPRSTITSSTATALWIIPFSVSQSMSFCQTAGS